MGFNFKGTMKAMANNPDYVQVHDKNPLAEAALSLATDAKAKNECSSVILKKLQQPVIIIDPATATAEEKQKAAAHNLSQRDKYVTENRMANLLFNNSVNNIRDARKYPMYKTGYINGRGEMVTQHKEGSKINTTFTSLRCYLEAGTSINVKSTTELDKRYQAYFGLVSTFRRGYDNTGKSSLLIAGTMTIKDTKDGGVSSATVTFVYGKSTTENGKLEPFTKYLKNISEFSAVSIVDGVDKTEEGFREALDIVFANNFEINTSIYSPNQLKNDVSNIIYESDQDDEGRIESSDGSNVEF